jgi:hypothetical protein
VHDSGKENKKRSARGTSATFGLFAAAAVFRSVASGTRERRKRVVMERTRRAPKEGQSSGGGWWEDTQHRARAEIRLRKRGGMEEGASFFHLPCAPTPLPHPHDEFWLRLRLEVKLLPPVHLNHVDPDCFFPAPLLQCYIRSRCGRTYLYCSTHFGTPLHRHHGRSCASPHIHLHFFVSASRNSRFPESSPLKVNDPLIPPNIFVLPVRKLQLDTCKS